MGLNPIDAAVQGFNWADGEGAQGVDWLKGELAKLGGLFGYQGAQGAPGAAPTADPNATAPNPAHVNYGPFAGDGPAPSAATKAVPVRASQYGIPGADDPGVQARAIAAAQAAAQGDPTAAANPGDGPPVTGGTYAGYRPIAGVPVDPNTGFAKPNMLRVIGDVLGGRSIPQSIDYESRRPMHAAMEAQNYQIQQAQVARMQQFLAQLSPADAEAFMANPAEWSKNYSTRHAVQTPGPGQIAYADGVPIAASPAAVPQGTNLLNPVNGGVIGGNAAAPVKVGASESIWDPASQSFKQAPAAPVVQSTAPGYRTDVIDPNDPAQPTSANAYVQSIIGGENAGGNPGAKNPLSSATGNGQFISSTWLSLMKSARPDLTAGKTDQQILGMRSDPNLSAQMIGEYAKQNGQVLGAAGVPVNAATLGVAHGLGAGDAVRVLKANPQTPLPQILNPAVISANPQFARMTAGDYVSSRVQRFGTGAVDFGGAPQGGAHAVTGGVRNVVQGNMPSTLSPQQAREAGLGPGLWQQLPTGEFKQVSAPTADDLKRVSDARGAAIAANDEAALEQQFLQHNAASPTGMGYFGEGYNPLAQWQMHNDPHVKAMVALQAQQLFKMKPDNAGLRILQSELPWWEKSTMDIDNTYDVNAGIAKAHQQQAQLANQRADFYQNWLYSHPSMDGVDQAWNAQLAGGKRGGVAAPTAQQPGQTRPVARQAPPTRGPQPGQVVKGYRFNGGNPGDKANWTRVQ